MKRLSILLLSAFCVASFFACEDVKKNSSSNKDNSSDQTDNPLLVGFWVGSYNGTSPFSMQFISDGTVKVYDGADSTATTKAVGTYTISDSVRTNYTFPGSSSEYSTAAKLNDEGSEMTGTFGKGTATSGSGSFVLFKQNKQSVDQSDSTINIQKPLVPVVPSGNL